MNAETKAEILALADTAAIDQAIEDNRVYLKRRTREAWDTLDQWQRREYLAEARYLHRVYDLPYHIAAGTVRRMVRIGAWK